MDIWCETDIWNENLKCHLWSASTTKRVTLRALEYSERRLSHHMIILFEKKTSLRQKNKTTNKKPYSSSYGGQITYFIGGYISSRQTGHSSWSLKKYSQVRSIHRSKVFAGQKYSHVKSIYMSKVFAGQKYLQVKSIHMSKVFATQRYSQVKSIYRSKLFRGQKYSQVKSIYRSKVFTCKKYLKKTYFTSCENSGSSVFFGASGSMAKCSCRALKTWWHTTALSLVFNKWDITSEQGNS